MCHLLHTQEGDRVVLVALTCPVLEIRGLCKAYLICVTFWRENDGYSRSAPFCVPFAKSPAFGVVGDASPVMSCADLGRWCR